MNTRFRVVVFTCLLAGLSIAFSTHAADITNPGFEQDWEGWTQGDPSGSGTAISKKAHSGDKSVKLTEKSSYAAQVVAVQPKTTYRLSAFVLGTGNLGAKVGTEMYFEQTPKKTKEWEQLTVSFNSGDFSAVTVFAGHAGLDGQFDDFSLNAAEEGQAGTSIGTKGEGGSPGANNWVFSSAPAETQKSAGAVDGTLRATLAVNHVTTTGDNRDIGQVVIGQIHAGKDEPARLYYQKFPDSQRGALYLAHEPSGGDDIFVELLGRKTRVPEDPEDGIALDEKFSYEIRAEGHNLTVTISQGGKVRAQKTIDMSASGYDVANDYMYFKAGVYNQNKSGDPEDYVQATFYELENSHTGYDY